MLVTEIIGKEVLDKNANRLGKVTDLEIIVPPGTVQSVYVKVGITKKLTINIGNVATVGDRLILNVAKEELEQPTPTSTPT